MDNNVEKIMGNMAEAVFHRGAKMFKSICLPEGNTPGFEQLGRAVHGYVIERKGNLFAISSRRLRSAGWYRSAVIAKMTEDGKFRVVEKEVAEQLLPKLEGTDWQPPEKPKQPFTGELKAIQKITLH